MTKYSIPNNNIPNIIGLLILNDNQQPNKPIVAFVPSSTL